MRSSIRRTWRSVTFSRAAASTCVRCRCCTSCNTFNRSRSRWLKVIRSVSMGPSAIHESGHFYFAQSGHSHFAATLVPNSLCRGQEGRTIPAPVVQIGNSGLDSLGKPYFLLLVALAHFWCSAALFAGQLETQLRHEVL